MNYIVQMERKVERQTEKEAGNQMKDNMVLLDVWDGRQLRVYGAWREHQSTWLRKNQERIKKEWKLSHQEAYLQPKT